MKALGHAARKRGHLALVGAVSLFGLGVSPGAAVYHDAEASRAPAAERLGFVAMIPAPVGIDVTDARYAPGVGERRRGRSLAEAMTHAPRMTIRVSATEQRCLAEALYYEARGEGAAGQMAVAEVVVRRSKTSGYPRSICGVVYQGNPGGTTACQFSWACNGDMRRGREAGAWSRARQLASRIGNGKLALGNTTQRALFFHATSVRPHWPGLVRTAQIGRHVFYARNPRWRGMGAAGRRIRSRAIAVHDVDATPKGGMLMPDGTVLPTAQPEAIDITVRPQADAGA